MPDERVPVGVPDDPVAVPVVEFLLQLLPIDRPVSGHVLDHSLCDYEFVIEVEAWFDAGFLERVVHQF